MEASARSIAQGSRTAVIIEDEADIRMALEGIFTAAGFIVHTFDTGLDGVEGVRTSNPDVVTLDLGLGDIDGFEVARRVRLFSDAYIVILSARAQELDTLLGLEAGADDYVTKPFRPRELRYRVEALLRRPRVRIDSQPAPSTTPVSVSVHDQPGTASPAGSPVLTHNGLRLIVGSRTVELSGAEVRLTRSEFDVLHELMRHGRSVVSKDVLSHLLHGGHGPAGYVSAADGRAVHVHITNLRRKLGDAAASPRWVETVRGVGYRLAGSR